LSYLLRRCCSAAPDSMEGEIKMKGSPFPAKGLIWPPPLHPPPSRPRPT
jgi:hypothetical protein